MKIIFYRYNSICEPDLIDAFRALRFEIIEECAEMTQKHLSVNKKIANIGRLILEHRPLFVFSINFFPSISDVCERLDVLYVTLSVDCPVLELYDISITNKHNRIFLFDKEQYEHVQRFNPDCVFHMPLAVNTERYDAVLPPLDTTRQTAPAYQYDVSFVGSLYNEKSPLLSLKLDAYEQGYFAGLLAVQKNFPYGMILQEGLTAEHVNAIKKADTQFPILYKPVENMDTFTTANHYLAAEHSHIIRVSLLNHLAAEFQVDIFTLSDTSELKNVRCHGGVSTHRQMPVVFRNSKINLNPTILSIQTGLPQRIWDILGCGGFLLTNYQSELTDYFTIGRDLDCYESEAECHEKIHYYLSHDDIRREIAMNGYRLVKEKHTYYRRAIQILQVIEPTISRSTQQQ